MSNENELLLHLRCPFCAATLEQASAVRQAANGDLDYGVFACSSCAAEFPVVAGIPILMAAHETIDSKYETTELTILNGPKVEDLVGLLKKGDAAAALAALLNPVQSDGNWFPALSVQALRDDARVSSGPLAGDGGAGDASFARRVRRRAERVAKRRLGGYALPRARARLARFLERHQGDMSALEAIDLYYRRYSGTETYNYFAFRFGQPRHLAGLSLALPLLEGRGPLLDLACGAGHMTHFFKGAQPERAVIGLDRDFFRLWLAKHYTAPTAMYVCAPADRTLPFADGGLSGVFCSDAFHYFMQRAGTVRELRRLIDADGVIVLARFGNVRVEPREGYELPPADYARLFGDMPHVVLGEDELIASYRQRRGPDLSRRAISDTVAAQKWLSIVASHRESLFVPAQRLESWPHAVGKLQLNPLYRVEKRGEDGAAELRFQFPSEWYEFENQGYLEYAPKACTVPGELMRALESEQAHPDLERYIAQLVVLGMPQRYLQA